MSQTSTPTADFFNQNCTPVGAATIWEALDGVGDHTTKHIFNGALDDTNALYAICNSNSIDQPFLTSVNVKAWIKVNITVPGFDPNILISVGVDDLLAVVSIAKEENMVFGTQDWTLLDLDLTLLLPADDINWDNLGIEVLALSLAGTVAEIYVGEFVVTFGDAAPVAPHIPTTPTNVAIVVTNWRNFNITWDGEVGNVDTYIVQRQANTATVDGIWEDIAEVDGAIETYDDTPPPSILFPPYNELCYRIVARNSLGDSSPSVEDCLAIPVANVVEQSHTSIIEPVTRTYNNVNKQPTTYT